MTTIERADRLMQMIKDGQHPLVTANEIEYFISDFLRAGSLSVYDAFCLNDNVLALRRMGYTKPAYARKVQISTCLDWMNQKLMAELLEDPRAGKYRFLALEAQRLNKEIRPHYIMDQFEPCLDAQANAELLSYLKTFRKKRKPENQGPYHDECFPAHHFVFEDPLLAKLEKGSPLPEKKHDQELDSLFYAIDSYVDDVI